MRFHLPKPMHGWRGFIGEVGIIVVGVLIALAAEQFVQAREWRGRVAEARLALRQEIADAAGSAKERIEFQNCARGHLDEVQAKIMGSGATLDKPLLVTRYYSIIAP